MSAPGRLLRAILHGLNVCTIKAWRLVVLKTRSPHRHIPCHLWAFCNLLTKHLHSHFEWANSTQWDLWLLPGAADRGHAARRLLFVQCIARRHRYKNVVFVYMCVFVFFVFSTFCNVFVWWCFCFHMFSHVSHMLIDFKFCHVDWFEIWSCVCCHCCCCFAQAALVAPCLVKP